MLKTSRIRLSLVQSGEFSSSGREETHNPLVVGSSPTGPTYYSELMAFVYILKGTSGRFYIGATEGVEARLKRHNSGMVHSTKRLGLPMELVVSREFESMEEAYRVERMLKRWKSPAKAIRFLKEGH